MFGEKNVWKIILHKMKNRNDLPFRRNCEGYFLIDGKLLVKDSGKGFLIFPGGGIDESETIEEGMTRETKEETGANIKNLKKLGTVKIIWNDNWAKTDKQKIRFDKFKGDEMHFFAGDIDCFVENEDAEEDFWGEQHSMNIKEAIKFIENSKPFDSGIKEYREAQIEFLILLDQELKKKL
ncbi:NUDIX hydrolase [Candidatus Pacearchaeota archaeon]|nr:NUDIX hydrolase [Candidatus Pacearchaeota archaeon]